jgi:hypothetical protein
MQAEILISGGRRKEQGTRLIKRRRGKQSKELGNIKTKKKSS